MEKMYTMEEVARHNTATDLWLVMHGGVYDLTDFLKKHPGGEEVFIKSAGTDCTVCFDEIGHTEEAKLLKENFKIGELVKDDKSNNKTDLISESSQATAEANTPTVDVDNDDDWEYTEPKKESNRTLSIILAASALIYAILFYYIYI